MKGRNCFQNLFVLENLVCEGGVIAVAGREEYGSGNERLKLPAKERTAALRLFAADILNCRERYRQTPPELTRTGEHLYT